MSKYTTEVRFICEEAAGLDESHGYNDVNSIVEAAWPKIFDSSLNFYNVDTRNRLLPKILLHYYTREIGFETVGLWKLKLNQKLREILPYYNQLYASEDLEYDPLSNVNATRTHDGSYSDSSDVSNVRDTHAIETRDLTTVDDGSKSFAHDEDVILRHVLKTHRDNDETTKDDDKTLHGQDSLARTVTSSRDHWVMYSDTPQGGINGVQLAGGVSQSGTLSDNSYLTNATHETESPAATQDTTTYGDVTNQFGKVTEKYGDIMETYNPNEDKKDNTHKEGWDKADNTNKQTGTINNTGTITDTNTKTDSGDDSYIKKESGKIGVLTYQEMVKRYRETFLNIDMQIIEELDDLFMKVW